MTTPQLYLAPRVDPMSPVGRSAGRTPSLLPKEHGAWGQLLVPLVVALALGEPTWQAVGWAIATVSVFLAHEPVLVLIGQRGTRQRREFGDVAKIRALALFATAAAVGGAAANWASKEVLAAALVPLGFGLVALIAMLRRKERTMAGELWAALTLPSAMLPVALESRVSWDSALACWLSLALAYAAGVVGVRGVIRNQKEGAHRAGWLGLFVVCLGIVGLARFSVGAALAAGSFWVICTVTRMLNPSLKALRQVGWSLVAASVAQATWLLIALR